MLAIKSLQLFCVFCIFIFANKLPYICEFTVEREPVTIQKALKQQLHSITDERQPDELKN